MKHTKGKWIAVSTFVEHEDDDIPDICSCYPPDFDQGHLERSYDEMCANATLMAAAPDLLACLKNAVKSLEWAAIIIKDIPVNSDYMEGIDEAKEIIDRATGVKL